MTLRACTWVEGSGGKAIPKAGQLKGFLEEEALEGKEWKGPCRRGLAQSGCRETGNRSSMMGGLGWAPALTCAAMALSWPGPLSPVCR